MAQALGCDGKWAIHPSQIEVANEVFTPSTEDIAKGRRIVSEYQRALDEGKGAIAIDGEMVDAATLKMAELVVQKAEAAGL